MLTTYRWHADIKPDNILFFEDRLKKDNSPEEAHTSRLEANEITFKLADPGFARFVQKQDKPTDIPKEYLDGGTLTYGTCFLFLGLGTFLWYCMSSRDLVQVPPSILVEASIQYLRPLIYGP